MSTPLAVIDTASSNRASIVGLIICAAETAGIAAGRVASPKQPAAVLVASLRKPPTTDEYTPLAELLTPPGSNAAVLGGICAAENSRSCHWRRAVAANSNCGSIGGFITQPPTTDEYTPLAEL
jgi:hypothetical protein